MDYNLPGSSVHGILQGRIMEWVTIPFSKGSSQLKDRTWFPAIQANFLPSEPSRKLRAYQGRLKFNVIDRSCPSQGEPTDEKNISNYGDFFFMGAEEWGKKNKTKLE